jgi:hypothetical protein
MVMSSLRLLIRGVDNVEVISHVHKCLVMSWVARCHLELGILNEYLPANWVVKVVFRGLFCCNETNST